MKPRFLAALVIALVAGCAFDFDRYDPLGAPVGHGGAGSTGGGSDAGGGEVSSAGGMAGGGAGGGDGGSGGQTGAGGAAAGGMGGRGPMVVAYLAVVADCIDPAMPDPDACAATQPPNTVGVDGSSDMVAVHSFLRFDFDEQLAERVIAAVTLELTVSSYEYADSSSSGEVWEVAPFSRDDLFLAAPGTQGSAPLAGDLGTVNLNQIVSFSLPTNLVTPGGSAFMGVLPVSSNGIDYWNLDGPVPPKLVVTTE